MEKTVCTVSSCYAFGRYCRIPGHAGKPKPDEQKVEKKKAKEELSTFFDLMLKRAPKKCQESGKDLRGLMNINPRVIVAHILPKRPVKQGGVPSMANDKRNIIFLHGDVHTDMDNKGKEYVMKMKIFPLIKSRVEDMWGEIPEDERKNVPDYLRPKI